VNPITQDLPLRDIHLPGAVSWWPPAPGWWVLLALVVLLIAIAAYLVRRYQRQAIYREAHASLETIRTQWERTGNQSQLLDALSILLRRLGISLYPRAEIAGLTGIAWLDWLDHALETPGFRNGAGRVLATARWSGAPDVDADALLDLCRQWIDAQKKNTGTRT